MATVIIPSLLRKLTGGKSAVSASGRTIGEVVDGLEGMFPGIRDRLCDGGKLKPSIVISVDGSVSLLGLPEKIHQDSEILILPAVNGG